MICKGRFIMTNISAVAPGNQVSNIRFKANVSKSAEQPILGKEASCDSFEFQHLKDKAPLAKEDKQEIIRSARQNASGWSIFGGPVSTLYYGLRSDKTVADKYNLDVNNDKKLIKKIKNEQMLWTIPSLFAGAGGIVAYLYNRNMDPDGINVDNV